MTAFVHYRPDLRYVKNMAFLAGKLLYYCEDEKDTFICFANLVHDHYFPVFIEGILSDFQLRVSKFDKYFKDHLPDLFDHFDSLEIKT